MRGTAGHHPQARTRVLVELEREAGVHHGQVEQHRQVHEHDARLGDAEVVDHARLRSGDLDGAVERAVAQVVRPVVGRDHHPQAFTLWMAGGGIKAGITYGATDDLGFHVVDKPVHVHDIQATLLHCLGFDHELLTYRTQGRDFRLTDIHGRVVREVLA